MNHPFKIVYGDKNLGRTRILSRYATHDEAMAEFRRLANKLGRKRSVSLWLESKRGESILVAGTKGLAKKV